MSNLIQQSNHLAGAARRLADHAGGDACQALVGWIDALLTLYKDELVEVAPDDLQALQAQVRQLAALRSLACGEVQSNGRI